MARRNWSLGPNPAADQLLRDSAISVSKLPPMNNAVAVMRYSLEVILTLI